ncbi:MAG: LOG family protein [Candidatus Pacearchaeota archaeon]
MVVKKRGKKKDKEHWWQGHKNFKVVIFGSSRIKNDDSSYKRVKNLAKMIGERGIDVITGGGPGLMKAASYGHHLGRKKSKVKTHTFGLSIRLPNEQETNKFVDIEKNFVRFSNRIDNFMLLANAIVIAPGGVGTLLELFYSWQLVQVKQACDIPIILMGDQWPDLIKWLKKYPMKKKLIGKDDMNFLFFVKTPEEAMEIIDKTCDKYNKGEKDFCLNYKKYKFN